MGARQDLREIWGKLYDSLQPHHLAVFEISDDYDLSAARLLVRPTSAAPLELCMLRRSLYDTFSSTWAKTSVRPFSISRDAVLPKSLPNKHSFSPG